MKKLSLLVLASIVFASASAQTKPGAPGPAKDTTKYPIGNYILVLNVPDGIDLMRGLQLTDYSKTKTDILMQKIADQMKTQEDSWRSQQGIPKGTSAPLKADSAKHK